MCFHSLVLCKSGGAVQISVCVCDSMWLKRCDRCVCVYTRVWVCVHFFVCVKARETAVLSGLGGTSVSLSCGKTHLPLLFKTCYVSGALQRSTY